VARAGPRWSCLAGLARIVVGGAGIALATAGASTRAGDIGPLPNREPLLRLVVSDDLDLVHRECRHALAPGTVVGCVIARIVVRTDGRHVHAVTLVRYADVLPSPLAFEIELHELCHFVASLQSIDDPCHVGNQGLLDVGRVRQMP
jgi:hypothetical protein